MGPFIVTFNTVLCYPLFYIWDPAICLITAVYSILTIRLFLARRKEFDAVLASGSSNINKDKYMRLLCLAAVGIVLHLPLSLWIIIVNVTAYPVAPWVSWDDLHSNFGRIGYFNRFILQISPDAAIQLSAAIWAVWLAAVLYFALFGFGEEAMKQYREFIGILLRPFGIKYPQKKKRSTIKRTWLDVLLRRPGKPTNLSSSAPTSSMPQFNSKPSASRPTGNSNPTQSHTTTAGGGNDLNLDIANLDFLDPAEARKQARISAYTRPGQATRGPLSPKGHAVLRSSLDSSIHRNSNEHDRIDEEKGDFDRSEGSDGPSQPSSSRDGADDDVDLEAQQSEIQQERRRAILEANPELTEEMTI
jgi:hypothetical protein